ncbi:MAG: hypothetical protein AAF667_05500 [Pseudomonadota bacterium]
MQKILGHRLLLGLAVLGIAAGCTLDEQAGEAAGTGLVAGAVAGAVVGAFNGDMGKSAVVGGASAAAGSFVADQMTR